MYYICCVIHTWVIGVARAGQLASSHIKMISFNTFFREKIHDFAVH